MPAYGGIGGGIGGGIVEMMLLMLLLQHRILSHLQHLAVVKMREGVKQGLPTAGLPAANPY